MENKSAQTTKKSEPKKKVIWKFNEGNTIIVSEESVRAENEKRFSFKLERYKDSDTFEESLKITSYLRGKENGSIVTSILDLDSDIKQLRKYGVVLENTYYRDLYKTIEQNYLDISETSVTLGADDNRITDLIGQVKLYVEGDKTLIKDDLCYVPVNMFNDLAYDCGYSSYEMKTLRASLDKQGYLHTVGDRYAILARINGKPERVIAFDRKKLGIELPTKKDSKKTETSDTNEA
ncbi:hypothetical protein LY28_02797 [Ruminiclostridium sufflavum DSM 19573]|uniref:Uncharacterized protein n=1 Tax=Ruminiclostridium sufflavum DSM 19573 TaxID=1121337 RepID=A0A318Y403_9FIRM|nr:hypothetical protein [Ruminiclostridium sufflavum]PYG86771.1 hypothetical protein LY28_02797 [Ruminiclostridium sufflavum DSM 19573]